MRTTFCLCLTFASTLFAQKKNLPVPATLEICSVPLYIGMPKSGAIEALSRGCNLKAYETASQDSWFVTDKTDSEDFKGIIEFRNHKVSNVRHSWLTKGGASAQTIVRALVVATDHILPVSHKPTGATIVTSIKHEADYDTYRLFLELPNGRVVALALIETVEDHKVILLDLQEQLDK